MKIAGGENKHTSMPSTSKDQKLLSQDLLFQQGWNIWHSKEKRTITQIVPLTPKTGLSSQRSGVSIWKPTPDDGDRTRELYICSFVSYNKYYRCTQIFWNTIQISFVQNFVITNFCTLSGTMSTSHRFLQNQDFQVQNNIFFKEAMATKNVALQASKKNIWSLTRRSCQASTIPKRRVYGMKTRSMAKAATVVVVRQTTTPSPKQHDLQQKVSCWMDKARGSTKLSTPPCEVEDCSSSDSSSPSLKQALSCRS